MIYRLCGANNLKIYCLIEIEAILIGVLSIIISIIAYYCSLPLLHILSINYILSLKEILIITAIILMLIYSNVHVITKNISKTEIRYLGRR